MQTALATTNAYHRGIPSTRTGLQSAALGVTHVLSKEEEVFAEGDQAIFFYKVVSGSIRTSKLFGDGRRHVDAFHLPGDIFGIEAGGQHRFDAHALGDTTVIAYRRSHLDAPNCNNSALGREVMAAMVRSLERAQVHMLLLGRKSAVEKIAAFMLDLSSRTCGDDHVDLPMSRIDIADHLGLTIETVSRTLTRMERQGVIAVTDHRRSIVLRDKAALQRLDA